MLKKNNKEIYDLFKNDNKTVIIAGPCSVESREQILDLAIKLKRMDVDFLRGGTFKPRTNPHSFQGLKYEGLDYLIAAKKKTGLPIITEMISFDGMDDYLEKIDIIQIGSRNMFNYDLLTKAGKTGKPILLKRNLAATYEEWLMAAEYISMTGNNKIILCERGIRTYETETRNTLDIQAIPVMKKKCRFPIIIDPSHAAGDSYIIESSSLASVAAGCDGLMIEVHDNPNEALSDGKQALKTSELNAILIKIKKLDKILK